MDIPIPGNLLTILFILVAGWSLKKIYDSMLACINKMENRLDVFAAKAEDRSAALHARIDEVLACLTTVKVDVAGKVDKETCDLTHRKPALP